MTTHLTPSRLAELDALHAKMTLGPWRCGGSSYYFGSASSVAIYGYQSEPVVAKGIKCIDDSTGIVALHNSYPAISAALRAAWAERDTLAARLREAVELLRPLAATADWDDDNQYARAAAAFIASEDAK